MARRLLFLLSALPLASTAAVEPRAFTYNACSGAAAVIASIFAKSPDALAYCSSKYPVPALTSTVTAPASTSTVKSTKTDSTTVTTTTITITAQQATVTTTQFTTSTTTIRSTTTFTSVMTVTATSTSTFTTNSPNPQKRTAAQLASDVQAGGIPNKPRAQKSALKDLLSYASSIVAQVCTCIEVPKTVTVRSTPAATTTGTTTTTTSITASATTYPYCNYQDATYGLKEVGGCSINCYCDRLTDGTGGVCAARRVRAAANADLVLPAYLA
ncbi:uncharacterized protein B0I36DRAFT_346327 [Microdochium trichocladiopsis]|uniref:Uncharacterized protein n=1 Tax=Microdochium trichocladiopsis TaxID=1682393 RepID=A0A9P9BVB1_9PEZI|nr:uncharacterized protein B0I36DRAFT_346327 [Microdochium trichocladiopsis]KAH7038339.1 hypothetical protein B0I36DRAFT_346327 [Microdochium trichocladiopsis]